jgi:hypothetical protein
MATDITALPSQFDEALRNPRSIGSNVSFREGWARLIANAEKAVTELRTLIKWRSAGRNLKRTPTGRDQGRPRSR